MWRPDAELLARQLTDHFGIQLDGKGRPWRGGYPALELLPADSLPSEAFRLIIETKWRGMELTFVPGSYAGELVAQMGRSTAGQIDTFVRLAENCITERAQISFAVNGSFVSPIEPAEWPTEWHKVEIGITKSPAMVNTEDDELNDSELLTWTRRFTGLVFALMPWEEDDPGQIADIEGLPEGALARVEVNRYERSRLNRAACIELHGAICKACGFSFSRAYGPVGDGFIHVHHTTQVSEMRAGYVVDPYTDLVPLCPNCHAIAHRKTPPYTVDEIKTLLKKP